MKRFFVNILLHLTIIIGILASLLLSTSYIVTKKTNYKISKNINKIIIGHSQPECAYNDSLIDSFLNMSMSGTSYFFNYYALVPIIENNPHVKTVFIEYSNNVIDTSMSEWTWGEHQMPDKYQVFGNYIDKEGVNVLFKNNPDGLLNGAIKLLVHNFKVIIKSNYGYTFDRGGFRYLIRDKLNQDIKNNDKIKVDSSLVLVSEHNLFYLEKIIKFCESKNIKVYLVRSPLHKKYMEVYNEPVFQHILAKQFKSTEFLDFKNFPLQDSDFADLHHLNYKGAKKYSFCFNNLIKNGLLLRTDKQKFIDSTIYH